MFDRSLLSKTRRWVVKIGSATLTADGNGLDMTMMSRWVDQLAELAKAGHELVVVSSGAVAEGMCRMGWSKRPAALHELQAAAAIGQMGLIRAWESCFAKRGLHTAQVLLTHDDLTNRSRYLNARSTLRTLLQLDVIPVVNENDTVATDELRFGDNDTLAALVANLVQADLLVLLTDQDGLYTSDPRKNPDAKLIDQADASDPSLDAVAGGSAGSLGRGGMATKLRAARLAARSGTPTMIASGRHDDALRLIAAAGNIGTLLLPRQTSEAARKQWLAGVLEVRGELRLDDGASQALRNGKSLLPVGVVEVIGNFRRGDVVTLVDSRGRELGRGLAEYSFDEASQLAGCQSENIESVIGYRGRAVMVHRDELVIFDREDGTLNG